MGIQDLFQAMMEGGHFPLVCQETITEFNAYKEAGGDDWKEIRNHCENWSDDEECGECGTCGQRFTRGDGYGCRECMPSDSESD
jgi:hypothetical protein